MAAFKKFKSARIGFVFRNLVYFIFYDFSIFNKFLFLSRSIQPDAMRFVVPFYIRICLLAIVTAESFFKCYFKGAALHFF